MQPGGDRIYLNVMERIPAAVMYQPLDSNAVRSQNDLQKQSTGLHQRRNEQQMLIYDAGTERQRERCTWYLLLFSTKKCSRHTMLWLLQFFSCRRTEMQPRRCHFCLIMRLGLLDLCINAANVWRVHSWPSYTLLLAVRGCDSLSDRG